MRLSLLRPWIERNAFGDDAADGTDAVARLGDFLVGVYDGVCCVHELPPSFPVSANFICVLWNLQAVAYGKCRPNLCGHFFCFVE